MLRFFVLLMRRRLPHLSRYLERSLAMSCDQAPRHDPSAPIPAGYEQPQGPPTKSCSQPPSLGQQDQGYRPVILSPPPSPHQHAPEESEPDVTSHLLTHIWEVEETKSVMFPQSPLYANNGPRPPGNTSAVSKLPWMAELQIKSNNFKTRSFKVFAQPQDAKDFCEAPLPGPQDEPIPTG